MINLFHLFLISLIGSVFGLIGGIVFLFNKKLSSILETNSIPFAAGVMITASVLGLLPEAFELIESKAFVVVLISFFTAYLFEHLIFGIHHHADNHHEGDRDIKSSVPLVVLGDTIHNFIDGVAMGAAYLVSPGLGLATALSTFLHEVPHEIGDFGILIKAGWRKRDVLTLNLISSVASIIGAFAVLWFSENDSLIGILLSVSAGIFLYLGSIDFLPRAAKGFPNKLKAAVPLCIGIASMLLILILLPH